MTDATWPNLTYPPHHEILHLRIRKLEGREDPAKLKSRVALATSIAGWALDRMRTIIVHYFATPESNILHCNPPPPHSHVLCIVLKTPIIHDTGYERLCILCGKAGYVGILGDYVKSSHRYQGEKCKELFLWPEKTQVFVGELTLEMASKISKESSGWIRMNKVLDLVWDLFFFYYSLFLHDGWVYEDVTNSKFEKHDINWNRCVDSGETIT